MKRYLLDTNACIALINNPDSPVYTRFAQVKPSQIRLCAIVKAELLFGAMKSQQREKSLQILRKFFAGTKSMDFNDGAAQKFGEIKAHLQQQGTLIGPFDTLIAAIALEHDLTLVTHNIREFARVPDLQLEDWQI